MTDPIADFLIRIKNGYLAKKKEVVTPYSKVNLAIAQKLAQSGYLGEIKKEKGKEIRLALKYQNKLPRLTQIKRVSKPGLRVYQKAGELKKLTRYGMLLISSPKGIITNREAIKNNLGGEVICQVC